jgi:hypothetical protein
MHVVSQEVTPDSALLFRRVQKAGIDFQRHEEIVISPNDFVPMSINPLQGGKHQ